MESDTQVCIGPAVVVDDIESVVLEAASLVLVTWAVVVVTSAVVVVVSGGPQLPRPILGEARFLMGSKPEISNGSQFPEHYRKSQCPVQSYHNYPHLHIPSQARKYLPGACIQRGL